MNETTHKRWGMTIDVNRCVGCQTCTVACKHANDTVPGVQWRKVLDVEVGRYPDVERLFLVTGCQHCAEPSCVPVCPTGATKQRADGLVTMDYDLCIGCASCAVACPYQARTIVHDKPTYFGITTPQETHVAHDERVGVAQKCTFCIDRVDDGLEAGLRPGDDPLATPACASSCISSAIKFGDFNDPESQVSKLVANRDYFQMHEELGNDPQIKYLIETPAVPARLTDESDLDEEAMSDLENPLVGKRQTFWDMRAAMNFIMGGLGSGTVVMAYMLSLFITFEDRVLININISAALIMAIGLFFVWLKIGRKLRAAFAILRPQTSWMSREIYAVGLLFASVAADYFQPSPYYHGMAALGAAAFLYCQGRILHSGKGIPSWRVPEMPLMLIATGLLEGTALLAMIFSNWSAQLPDESLIPPLAIILILINAYLWRRYIGKAKSAGIGPLDRRIFANASPKIHLIGHILPLILFSALLFIADAPVWIAQVAGFLAIMGGISWKAILITRACHMQGFALGKMPQRGSGKFAAPLSKVG
jgi:phenylacetyl-CoA:acceptor oxidoreductase subunit 1